MQYLLTLCNNDSNCVSLMYHCIATDAQQLMLTIQNILQPARCFATRSICAGKIIHCTCNHVLHVVNERAKRAV